MRRIIPRVALMVVLAIVGHNVGKAIIAVELQPRLAYVAPVPRWHGLAGPDAQGVRRCNANTTRGTACRNPVKVARRCWQHGG